MLELGLCPCLGLSRYNTNNRCNSTNMLVCILQVSFSVHKVERPRFTMDENKTIDVLHFLNELAW